MYLQYFEARFGIVVIIEPLKYGSDLMAIFSIFQSTLSHIEEVG